MTLYPILNNQIVDLDAISLVPYPIFFAVNDASLKSDDAHCCAYFGLPDKANPDTLNLYCAIADDADGKIFLSGASLPDYKTAFYPSLSQKHFKMHIFERELHENYAVNFTDHPWYKPVRFPKGDIDNYPFYKIDSQEIHEVGVGPIHAGVIEPGHFRFLCNGEFVYHLEIMLGYQHRGIEKLMLDKNKIQSQAVLCESIAGDTAVSHVIAYCQTIENLAGINIPPHLQIARTIASELERIAMHTADLSALCLDVAYQLGSSVYGALRTPLINYFQWWCGNRFGKGLFRPGAEPFPLTPELIQRLRDLFNDYYPKFTEISDETFALSSVLNRFDKAGIVTHTQALNIGAVGMSARTCGVKRDIRISHPYAAYQDFKVEEALIHSGDCLARAILRREEIDNSVAFIRYLLDKLEKMDVERLPRYLNTIPLKPNQFSLSLTEGWRGEISHTAITDSEGNIVHYKLKDPSMHNWLALALAVRNNEISDFPICNKSFDLSYCGHDL